MIAFWILAALVAAAGLALALRSSLSHAAPAHDRNELNLSVYRDQLRELEADLAAGSLARADYERAKGEIERRLLEDVTTKEAARPSPSPRRPRLVAKVAAAAIPLFGLAIYLAIGTPAALDPARRNEAAGMKEIEAMVQGLADRLEKNPEDVDGWKMLGRSYTVMGRFAEAATAYSKAAARAPRDPGLLADLADALAMARGQKLAGEPEELVMRALQLDPKNLKALALAGTAAFEKSDYAGAARYWERMLANVPPDAEEDRRQIQANIDEARSRAGSPPPVAQKGPAKPPARKAPETAAAGATIEGTVSLAPALKGKAAPDDTVFIFARAAEGPPMPLAVLRKKVSELPAQFSLDDSMAMTPAMKLSSFPRVVVSARISKTGNATAQPGDLQGASGPVASGARGVAVVIDGEVRPK